MKKRILPMLLLAACTSAEDGPTDSPSSSSQQVGGVEYSAETLVMESFPVQLRTIVTARATSGEDVALWFPTPCVVMVRAYADSARAGEPAWSHERSMACAAVIFEDTVRAGRPYEFSAPNTSGYDVLGDSLPDGRYWMSAVLSPNGQRIELPAGVVDLAVPRE